jgi:outer membrane protein assembly complex protein YaeT
MVSVSTLLRRLARATGLLAGLILIGLVVLHLPPVRSRVLDRARGYAERELGVALRASSLGYNLLTRSIELRDLSLSSTSAGEPFLEADRAVVVFGPGIFRGRATINRISLSRPRLTLVRYADGTLNLLASRTGAAQQAPLQLGIVSVTALSARLEDRVSERSFVLGPVDLSVDTAGTSGRPGGFGPGGFTVRAGQVDVSGTLAGRLGFDGTRVRIDELIAEMKEGRVALDGWADVIGERPAVSAHASANVDLLQAARLAGVDARGVAGHLEATADIAGALAAPTLALAVTSRDAAYGSLGSLRLAGRSTFNGTRAVIDGLDVDATAGSLHVEGAVELGEPPPAVVGTASRLAFRWANLHLDDLGSAVGQSLPIPSGASASGSATVDFNARDLEARAWSRLRAVATTTLQPAASSSAGERLALSGRADLQLDQGRWSLRHSIQAQRARTDLEGHVTGRLLDGAGDLRSTLGGRSRLRVADIGALPALMQAAGVRLPPETVEGLAGSMLATIDLGGTLESPRAQIDLTARELRARLLPHTADLDAQLAANANGVRAQPLRATTGTTSVQASGQYSWSGPFDARVEVSQGDLSEIASQFHVPVALSGSARLEGTISGILSSVTRRAHAVLALTVRDLAVEQIAIGTLAAKGTLSLENAGLMTVDATAPGIGARAQLEIINRDGYPVSGEITLDHQDIGTLIPARYRQQIGDVSGRLSASARGSGHLSNPTGIRGRIDLRELDVMARGTRLALAAPGSVTLTEDRIAVDGLDLRIGQRTRATLAGQLGVTALPETLRFHLDGPLSELIEIGSRTGSAAPVPVRGEGTAALDVTVQGTLNHPLPRGSLVVQSPSLEYGTLPAVTGLALDATIDPTLITMNSLAARWQGALLNAQGAVPWRVVLNSVPSPPEPASTPSSRLAAWLNALPADPARARLTLRAENVTQSVLKDVVAPERLQNLQGSASATVAVETDRFSLERIEATAVLDRASLTVADVPFTQSVPTRLRLENGRARIDDFQWTAEGNSIVATGGANLAEAQPTIELGVSGVLDLRVLSAFVSGVASGGTAHADLEVRGPLENPDIVGDLTVADGELQLDSPRLAASDLQGTLRVGAGRKVAVSMAGVVNTGNARLEGTLDLAELAAPLGKLQFTGRGIAMEYPSGLQTESNADIELTLGASSSTLSGRIDVLGGTYREALVLSSQLLTLSSANGIARSAPPAEWLSRLRLNVSVATASDLRIDNNYGRLDIGAAIRVVGTAANPGVLGRLQAADGGEIYLGGNTYRIERLAIDFTSPRAITPDVNFSAQTRIGDLPIGVELRCPAAAPCERKVTSLATNVGDKDAEAALFGTVGGAASAGESLARLLSGELLGVVGRTVGLDTIRLEQAAGRRDIFDDPTLISGDVDPAARLTLAKRLGSNVELVFSQNLADEGFTWITSYLGPFGLSWRLLVFDDQSRAYEFRHEPPIGAGRARQRPRPSGPRIAAVRIAGTPGFSANDVRRHLRLTEGDRFTFGAWQRDRDRLERFYHAQGLLEARVRARRLPAEDVENPRSTGPGKPVDEKVILEYAITRGPTTQLIIRGTTLPDAVRDRIVERWTSALFDGFLERDARTIVREHLYREGYLHATIATNVAVEKSGESKTLTIDVVPGSIMPSRIEVTGNATLPTEQLLGVVAGQPDSLAAWIDPASVERLLENHYRSEGFLAADVSVGAAETRAGTSVVTIRVDEGPPYAVGEVRLSGLPDEPVLTPRDALALSTGERYRPGGVAEGVGRLEVRLRRAAYRQASIDVETSVDAKAARVDIAVVVTAGPRSILRQVVVHGDNATKPPVARSIVLAPDAPLDPAAIAETRKRLYDLDVYRSVDIEVQPLAAAAPQASTGAPAEQPVVARITLGEAPRYRFRYGLALNDEVVSADERDRRLGFAADLENRNMFGRGASAGVSLRLRRDQQVGRVTLGANRLFGLPIRSTVFVERKREQLNPDGAFPLTSDITAVTAEQAYRARRGLEFRYGYGIERNHTFIRESVDPFDLTVTLARFTTSGLIDRRDDAFNPGRGWFAASTLELSTPGLGSDLRFLKDFAQYFHFVPVGRGLVVASAARLGLARTFGDEVLIPSERFYAGGAGTVRGYREDDLGARSVFDDAEGGSALLVLNGELRFPVYRWLKGVGFVDLGNIYPKVSEISLTELQIGVGAGARFDTPFGLIRFDIGVPANRRSFDPHWRIHFGLGHAF